jgi:hypothetical protein
VITVRLVLDALSDEGFMSYKPVVAALERDSQVALDEQVEQVMEPFMLDPDDPDRRSHCDGWWIGGHWTGHFLSRERGCPELVRPFGFPEGSPLSEYVACDGGPKGMLDLEYLRRTAEEEMWRDWPSRFARVFRLREPWRYMTPKPSEKEVKALVNGNPELLAQARGRAVILNGLVTLEGEWIDPCGGVDASAAAYRKADAYLGTLDDETWLVCLSVHF